MSAVSVNMQESIHRHGVTLVDRKYVDLIRRFRTIEDRSLVSPEMARQFRKEVRELVNYAWTVQTELRECSHSLDKTGDLLDGVREYYSNIPGMSHGRNEYEGKSPSVRKHGEDLARMREVVFNVELLYLEINRSLGSPPTSVDLSTVASHSQEMAEAAKTCKLFRKAINEFRNDFLRNRNPEVVHQRAELLKREADSFLKCLWKVREGVRNRLFVMEPSGEWMPSRPLRALDDCERILVSRKPEFIVGESRIISEHKHHLAEINDLVDHAERMYHEADRNLLAVREIYPFHLTGTQKN